MCCSCVAAGSSVVTCDMVMFDEVRDAEASAEEYLLETERRSSSARGCFTREYERKAA